MGGPEDACESLCETAAAGTSPCSMNSTSSIRRGVDT